MKRHILALTATLATLTGWAQTTSGTATYKETIKLNIQLDGDMAQYAEMIPREQIFDKLLHFTPESSLYVAAPKKEDPGAPGVRRIMIGGDGADEIIYKDLNEHKTVAQKDFMTRKILVSGNEKTWNWKMTGNQKSILGYACQEATAEVDSQKITAWYTPTIPVSAGPREYGGLPGLILEVNTGDRYSILATGVAAGAQDKKTMQEPKEGKKMSKEKFDEMVKEKMKEMQEENGNAGGNSNVIIKIQH